MKKEVKLTRFYIVRHGQSMANIGEDMSVDSLLTPEGEVQAVAIAKKFKDIQFDVVIASHLERARRTAEIIVKERQLAVLTTEAIREREYGTIHLQKNIQKVFEELNAAFAAMSEEEIWKDEGPYGFESNERAVSRFITYIREAAIAYTGKTVLIVSHGAAMRAFLVKLGFATFQELPARTIDNTGYIVVESDGVDFFIRETHGIHKKEAT